jgi:translation initiation factor 2B subunit (eIF-2B alpha/beta/delta family)
MAVELRRRLTHSESGPAAEIHLIEAATIGNIVPRVDCAVVGSDAISRSGAVLHKVGTLPLALCCRHFEKPVYALGHSLKQVEQELDEPPPPHSVPETRVFDITPAQLVTALVTERTENLYATRSAT